VATTLDLRTGVGRAAAQSRLRWELLAGLVRKDLKVKYQGSTLGFVWSLANPLLLLAVYSFVFQVVFKTKLPDFGIYLMTGLLIWTAFQNSVSFATGSVVGAANLVKKVRFPLSVLPLASVGFAGVHFLLQMGVLLVVMLAVGYPFLGLQLLLLVPATAVALTFTVALSMLVAALNVRYRDTQHLVDVIMIAWFWLNPIVYACGLVKQELGSAYWTYFLQPMAIVVATFQRALYKTPYFTDGNGRRQLALAADGYSFYLVHLAIAGVVSAALLWLGLSVYRRMQANFAEDL
jgi:ABC-2 type transport system permease protein